MIKNEYRILAVVLLVGIFAGCNQQVTTMNPPIKNKTIVEQDGDVEIESESNGEDREGLSIEGSSEGGDPIGVEQTKKNAELKTDMIDLIDQIKEIENHMASVVVETDRINHGSLYFLRGERFGYEASSIRGMVWNTYTGRYLTEVSETELDDEIVGDLERIVDQMDTIRDSVSDAIIDVNHMFAIIDLTITKVGEKEYEDHYYDAILSWAGDLETFMTDAAVYAQKDESLSEEDIEVFTKKELMDYTYSFPLDDLYADIDGYIIGHLMMSNQLKLSEAMNLYYSSYAMDRFQHFIDLQGGIEAFEVLIQAVSLGKPDENLLPDEKYDDFYDDFRVFQGMMSTFGNDSETPVPDWVRNSVVEGFRQMIYKDIIEVGK